MGVVSHDHSAMPRYITVLVEMTKFKGTRHGKLIASQMLDVSIRVKDVLPFAIRQMVSQFLIHASPWHTQVLLTLSFTLY